MIKIEMSTSVLLFGKVGILFHMLIQLLLVTSNVGRVSSKQMIHGIGKSVSQTKEIVLFAVAVIIAGTVAEGLHGRNHCEGEGRSGGGHGRTGDAGAGAAIAGVGRKSSVPRADLSRCRILR